MLLRAKNISIIYYLFNDFFMRRKAQSISINTIIIAAIALAVLVVLFLVFTGRFRLFSEGVKESSLTCQTACKSAGYSDWLSRLSTCTPDTTQIPGKFEGMAEREVCCCIS